MEAKVNRNGQTRFHQDERVGQVDWILSEFAAANAIIDSLCNHLRIANGGGGSEYAAVDEAIGRRRRLWTPFLNTLPHSPITDVETALACVAWKRRNLCNNHHNRHCNGFKRDDESGFKEEERKAGSMKESSCLAGEKISENQPRKCDDDVDEVTNVEEDPIEDYVKQEHENTVEAANESCGSKEDDEPNACGEDQNPKQKLALMAKTFVATERFDGMMINVVHGLKLYEQVIDITQLSKLDSLVNDLRADGKAGKLAGKTYIVYKRPMRGRGKEVIQLGFPIVDAPLIHDDSVVNHSKGPEVEPIPAQLQAVIHRLLDLQVLTSKPDACVIDVYNEGEYSQPHIHPPWYGRPLCVMFLSECDFTFGKIIWSDRSGHYNGSTKLSFAPGNLISMEGQAADFANHAIDATNKERILVTFTKSQPVKPRPMVSRPKNHGHWHIPSNGVMPASYIPSYHPNLMSGYVFQPAGFVYPNPCLVPQSGHIIPWHEPRHPIPGTGVFFPTNSEPDDKSRNSTSEHHDNKSKNLSNDDDDELHTITAGPEIARSGSDSK